MNGNLTDWLVKDRMAELRSQAARRQWRVDVKRARAEIGAVTEAVDEGGASATAGRPADAAVQSAGRRQTLVQVTQSAD